ncbi:unnamed protein product [Pedinophyceae sp. YPF-701]|nr:unnamed protein product [Pedinophyceae sp. YPF-701]
MTSISRHVVVYAGLGVGPAPEIQEKTHVAAMPRRVLDSTASMLNWLQLRTVVTGARDAPRLPPLTESQLRMYHAGVPTTSGAAEAACTNFAGESWSNPGVNAAAWTPDGRRLLVGHHNGEWRLIHGQEFGMDQRVGTSTTPIWDMRWLRSGEYVLYCTSTGEVVIMRPQPGLAVKRYFKARRDAIRALAVAPSDRKFATASDDSTVAVWDLARALSGRDGEEERALDCAMTGHGGDVKTCDWHPTKALIASGGKDGLVKLWDPRCGQAVGSLHAHRATVGSVRWNPSSADMLASGGKDRTVRVWDIRANKEVCKFESTTVEITAMAWHPLQEALLCSGGYDRRFGSVSMHYWQLGCPAPIAEVPQPHTGALRCLAWHPLGHMIASGGTDDATDRPGGSVRFWSRARTGWTWRIKSGTAGVAPAHAHNVAARAAPARAARADDSDSDNEAVPGMLAGEAASNVDLKEILAAVRSVPAAEVAALARQRASGRAALVRREEGGGGVSGVFRATGAGR